MITENSIVTGMNGRSYRLGAQIGTGGEGTVYAVQGDQLVVKIYKKIDPDHEGKLRYMVNHPIPTVVDQNGNPILNAAWPQDLIYDSNRDFVGYVMPRIENGIEIFQVERGCTAPKAKAKFPNYTWRLNVLVARNLAASVNVLHKQGYVIGDMNCKNFLVNTDGSISLLDTDSIDMTDPNTGKHYKCCVGMEDYLPPELQGRNLRAATARYTVQTDDFALAIHIFQLLMNNYHPFSGKQTEVKSSSSACGRMQQIVEGKCPYLHTYPDLTIPVGAPRLEDIVPDYIIQCFRNTFDYNSTNASVSAQRRTTAEQWTDALRRLLQECDSPNGLVRCQKDPSHYYLRSMGSCGICKAKGTPVPHLSHPTPVSTPAPAPTPKPKKKLWPVLVLLAAFAVFLVCMLTSPSGTQTAEPEAIYSGQVNAPEKVNALIAQGTHDYYLYQNGSRMEMYFGDDNLERCRIFWDSSGNVEYIFTSDYNSAGKRTKHVTYDSLGTVLRTDLYTYDSNGQLTERVSYQGIEEQLYLVNLTRYTYFENGRAHTIETCAQDGTVTFSGWSSYDENGAELYRYTEINGSAGEIQYDADGNVLSHISYDGNGEITYWTQYQYNASGQESGGTHYNADGTMQTRYTVQYDKNGLAKSQTWYDSDNAHSYTSYPMYGPRNIEIGSRSEWEDGTTSDNEYVESINGTFLKNFSSYASEHYVSDSVSLYDVWGNYMEYRSYDEFGNLTSHSVYDRDRYGYMTGETYTYYPGDGTRFVTIYDADGNELFSAHYDANDNPIE